MKKTVTIIIFILLALIFCGCSPENPSSPEIIRENETRLSEKTQENQSGWEIISGEFSEELMEWIYYYFPEERAKEIIADPGKNTSVKDEKSMLNGYTFTEVQFYHDKEGDPLHFSYIEKANGEKKILPEIMHWYRAYGVIGGDTVYCTHKDGVAFYKIVDFEIARTVWEPENAEIDSVMYICGKEAVAVFWSDGKSENFMLTLLDKNGKEAYTKDTGIKTSFIEGGYSVIYEISDSYNDFGVLRFQNYSDDFHPYDLVVDTGVIIDLEGVFGANDPPTHKEGPKLTVFEDKNGKFGLKNGEEVVVPAIYDAMTLREPNKYYDEPPFTHYYEGYVIDGTRKELRYSKPGDIPYLETAERKLCSLFDPEGKQLNDILFEDYEVSDSMVGLEEGTLYYYEYDGEKFVKKDEQKQEKTDTGFGYYITEWHWNIYSVSYGISDKHGNVILEPVYSKLEMPFADRICRYNGASAHQSPEFGHCELTDINGNIICDKFDAINYTVFEDGSYVGWAISGLSEITAYDENGKEMPKGYWFVDKDGNIISEHFTEFDFTSSKLGRDMEISVTLADGTEKRINTNDYIMNG